MNKITNNKIFKRIIITIIIFIILIITATIAIGNYFVNYAIARSGNGGDRKIKNENIYFSNRSSLWFAVRNFRSIRSSRF